MKLGSDSLSEGVFPKRRPLLAILVIGLIVAYPAYRLSLLVYGRLQPKTVSRAVVEPAVAQGRTARAADAVEPGRPPAATRIASVTNREIVLDGAKSASVSSHAASADRGLATNQVATVPILPPEQFREILRKGQDLEARGELAEAAKLYSEALKSCREERQHAVLQESLGRANIQLLLSKQSMPGKVAYVVKPNDAVEKIAKKSGTTKELISRINSIGSNGVIHVGQTLSVFAGKFSILVTKHNFELILSADNEFFKRYSVCIGSESKTPLGSFVVTEKEVNPTWWPAGQGPIPGGDQRNLLGTRWLAIKDRQNPADDKRGIGIHGTKDESSIGKPMSAGCIRMLNADVEELHMLVPVGTPVVVAE
jgi:lipoprotein-anchoring transpeptidase ErfK/SrfK